MSIFVEKIDYTDNENIIEFVNSVLSRWDEFIKNK